MGYFDNLAAKTKSAAVNAKKKKEDEEEKKARARAQRAAARPAQTQKSSAVAKAAGNIKKAYQAPAEKTKKAVQNESAHFRADRIARERQEDSNQLYARLNHGRGRAAYEERTRQAAETKSKAGDRGRRAFDMQGNLKENLQNMRQEKMGRYLDKNHQSAREQYQNRGRRTYLASEGAHNWNDTFDVGADRALLSSADYQTIQQLKQQWQAARRRGDTRGEDEAHRQAEQIRMKYGYSGGAGGGAYNEVSETTSSDVVAKRRQTNEYNLKTARENLAELERQGADRNSDTYRAARRRYQEARQWYLDAARDEADYLNSLYQYGVPGQALPQLSDSREINRQLRDELAREGMQYSSNPYTREQNRGEIARIEDARADLWQLDRAEGNVRNAALEQAAADYVREHGREALAAYRRDDNESALVNRGEAVRGYMQPLLAGEYAGNEAEALARYMTQEERDTYNYLRKTRGKQAASEYLSDTVERRNERWGQEIAREQEGNLFNQIMYGFVSGMDRTIGGAAQLFREDAVPTSHVQYAGERVREDLADKGPKILGSSLGQVAYDLANTTGNQLPQMGVAALTGGMGAPGWLTQLASSGLTTATVGGSSYSEKIREGYTPEQARSYAVISGALEGGLQYVLDGIRLTGKGAIPRAVQTRLQGIESGAARFAARYGSSMLSEGLEEGLQEILEPFVASATLDEAYTPAQLSDVLYSFLLGAVSAGVLEGPTALAEAADTRERGKTILQLGQETVDAIVEDGMRKAPGSTGRVLAEKIRGKQQAGESITPQILGALWRETRTEIGENIPVTQGREQKLDPVWEAAAEERTDGMPFDTEATLSDTEESPLYRAALDAERETFPETGRYTPEENPLAERTEAAPAKQVMTAAPMTAQTMAAGAGKTRRVTETPSRNVMEARADLEKVDRMASTLGRAGSAMFRRAYDADMAMTMDANTAFEGYSSVYYNRLTGQEIPKAAQSAVSALPPDLYQAAAAAGETDARAARQAKYFGKDAGLVRDRTFRKARVNSRTARALDAFAKSAGIQIRFADQIRTESGDEANASYNSGVLTIARDTESPVMTVTSHETVHRIREAAPEAYGALASFVMDNMSGETFGAVYNRYSEAYRTGNFDTISEELVAEAFGEMMSKGELLEEFFAADRSAGQKILDTLRDIINAIRKALSQNKGVLLSAEEARTFRELEKNLGEMADAFEAALAKVSRKAEADTGRAEKNPAESGGEKYSKKLDTRYDYSKSFSEQLDDFEQGKFPENDTFILSGTPKVMQEIGFLPLPLVINQNHVKAALYGTYKGTGEEVLDHIIPKDELANLPEKIANPVAIIQDKRVGKKAASESVVDIIITMKINGKQTLVPVRVDGYGKVNDILIDANVIASVHGNTDTENRLVEAIREHLAGRPSLYYIDKKITIELLSKAGNPIPGIESMPNGYIRSINEGESPVKNRLENVTESRQFKRWFGDWQNHPEKASKIVNEDGTPKVVYHGTKDDFFAFDTSVKGGANGTAEGFGIYTSPDQDVTKAYGERQMPLYADMKRPAYHDRKTIKASELRKLIQKTCEAEAQRMVDDGEYDSVGEAIRDTWISNYVNTYETGNIQSAYKAVADSILGMNSNDMDIVQEVMTGMGIRDYEDAMQFYHDVLTPATGIDGFMTEWKNRETGKPSPIYILFDSTQLKSATNNIGTFDPENPDIRYSVKNKKMPVEESAEKSPAGEDGGAKYSISVINGRYMPVIDTQNDTRKLKVAENFLKTLIDTDNPFATILEDAQPVYVGKDLPGEYKGSGYTFGLSKAIRKIKMQAATNLDEMLFLAWDGKWKKNLKEKHKIDAKNGWYRYKTEFAVPMLNIRDRKTIDHYSVYEGVLLIRNDADGKSYLYDLLDINKIEEANGSPPSTDKRSGVFEQVASSDPNVSQRGPEVKGKASLKSATRAEQEAIALVRENERLKERVEYWKSQIKRSAPGSVNPASVKRTASELARDFASKVDRKELTRMLQALYDTMGARKAAGETDVYAGIRETAESIAQWIVEEAVEKGAFFREYEDLIKHMKKTVIQVPDWVKADIPDFSQWKVGKRIRMSKNGIPIDVAYQELSQLFPGWFDEQKEITGSDQLLRIADVLGTIYSNEHVNPFEGHYDQAVTEVSNEILNRFFFLPENQTFADRMERKLAAEKQKRKDAVSAQREKSKKQWEKERAKLMDRYHEMIRNVREDRERKLAALRQEQRERTRAGRERQKARELRAQITRHVSRMSQQLLKPTDRQHVPEEMRGAVATLLHAINLESRERDGADPTKKTLAFRELRDSYERIMESGGDPLVYNPDLADGFLFRRVIEMGDTPILAMNSGQLEDIWQTVRAVEHAIATAGKMLTRSKYQTTDALANEMQQAAETRKQKKSKLSLDLELPVTFFSRFGDAGEAIYQMLRDAQDRRTTILSDMFERVQKEMPKGYDIRKARRDVREFTLESGDRVTLSRSNVMDLYNAYRREQGRSHLLQEGITQPEIQSKKIPEGSNKMALTKGDLDLIFQFLTKADRQMAETLQKLTAPLSDYGNEASMQAYGYQKFTEENYWPLKVASAALPTKVETLADARRSIANIGFSKATKENAGNALRLGDAFDIFAKHVIDMSLYASYLCPIEDVMRLYNYNFSRFDEMRNEWVRTGKTVKGIFDDVGGPRAQTYFTNLMADIQNEFRGYDTETEKVINRIVGAGKSAAVGLNLRVVLQQPTAIMRAVAVLNPAYLAKGMTGGATKGNGWAKAKRYAPIAQWKDWGSFDISRGPQIESLMYGLSTASEKIQNATGFLAGAADAVTWGAIWNACEWQVKARNKSVTPGTEAYYQKVASLFGDVINQSQVVDGVLQRSQIMRSSSSLIQQATAFQGEPIMTLNLLMRAWDKVRYEKDPKKKAAGRKLVSRAVTAIILNGVANALAQSIMDGIRDDDEDKKYLERVMTAFTGLSGDEKSLKDYAVSILRKGNVGDNLNMLSNVPFVRDALSLLEGYDVSRMDADVFAGIINDGKYLIQALQGDNKKTVFDTAAALLGSAAKLFGLPVSTVKRDVLGFVRSFAVESDDLALQYELAKLQYQLGNDKNLDRFVKYLTRAEAAGDQALYERIYNDLMARGVMPKEIEEKKKENLKKSLGEGHLTTLDNYREIAAGYTITGSTESEESWLDQASAEQQRTYYAAKERIYNDVADSFSPEFRKIIQEKGVEDKAAGSLKNLAEEMAKKEADSSYAIDEKWIQNALDGEAFHASPADVYLYHVAYEYIAKGKDENGDGKTDNGTKAQEAIDLFKQFEPDAASSTVAYVRSINADPPKELKSLSREQLVQYNKLYGETYDLLSAALDTNERSHVPAETLDAFDSKAINYAKEYAVRQIAPRENEKVTRKKNGVIEAGSNLYAYMNEGEQKGIDPSDMLLFEAIVSTSHGEDKNNDGKTDRNSVKKEVFRRVKKEMPWLSQSEITYMVYGHWENTKLG